MLSENNYFLQKYAIYTHLHEKKRTIHIFI